MPRAPLTDAEKRLRGTLHKRPALPSLGTPRIVKAIAPPRDLTPELQLQWRHHMAMIVASGRAASIDLLAFVQLIEAAHAASVAYRRALQDGPIEHNANGPKAGTAWRMWLATSAAYREWLLHFGLTPRGRQAIRQLPPPASGLSLVGNRDG